MAYSPWGPREKVTANLSTGGRKGVCQYRQKNNYVELLGQSCLKNINTFSFLRYTQQAVMPQEWTVLFQFLPCVLCSCCGFVFKNHKKKLLEVTNISSCIVTLERIVPSTVNASVCGKFYQTTLKKNNDPPWKSEQFTKQNIFSSVIHCLCNALAEPSLFSVTEC